MELPITITKISLLETNGDLHDQTIFVNLNRMESSDDISNLKGKINSGGTVKSHPHICISKEDSMDNNVTSSLSNTMKHSISSPRISAASALCYKMSIVFGICFIIGCFLLPFIFYYTNQTGGNFKSDLEYSYRQNISNAKVCNISYISITISQKFYSLMGADSSIANSIIPHSAIAC